MAMTFTKLTRQAMRKLKPGEKITEHGITFERLEDGDGRFTVNIMVDGQRIHRVVGRESAGTTRTQAEEFIAKVRLEAKEGRLNLPKGSWCYASMKPPSATWRSCKRKAGRTYPRSASGSSST